MVSQENEDDYDSASDSDFNDAELSSSSAGEDSDEADGTVIPGPKRKIKSKDADGDVEMASGDEGIVAQARKKKKKRKGKNKGKGKDKAGEGHEDQEEVEEDDEDDNAPVGVRVRLRSGRGGVEARNPTLPTTSTATADIDSIWARMNNPHASQPTPTQAIPVGEEDPREDQATAASSQAVADQYPRTTTTTIPQKPMIQAPESMVTIPHTYTFAGEVHTSTKRVPISSPAAIAYLASEKEKQHQTAKSSTQANAQEAEGTKTMEETISTAPPLRRPLARKGLLEPNPDHHINMRGPLPQRSDLPVSIGGISRYNSDGELVPPTTTPAAATKASLAPSTGNIQKRTAAAARAAAGGEKLNTVEKSKLDWEAEVERQGLREELEKAEKSGESYLGRVEFLKRVEGGEEERARVARLKRAGLA